MNIVESVRDFLRRTARVLTVSYRPTPEEFNTTAKVTAIGMLLIGLIGYIVALLFKLMEGM